MRNVVLSIAALVLLPVSIVVLVGAATGVLTGGITSAVAGDVVNGYDIDALRVHPAASVFPPDDRLVARHDVIGSSLVFGPDRPPVAGMRLLTTNSYDRTVRYYDHALESLGFTRIATPTPLIPQANERFAVVWQNGNIYARLVERTDNRELVEAGGGRDHVLYQFTISPLGETGGE